MKFFSQFPVRVAYPKLRNTPTPIYVFFHPKICLFLYEFLNLFIKLQFLNLYI